MEITVCHRRQISGCKTMLFETLLRRGALSALFLILTGSVVTMAQDPGGAARPPQPVTVVTMVEEDVTLTTLLPGRIVASGVAEVRPQVDGIIIERLFDEGSFVEIGDPLYLIDPASYEARVTAARAQVAEASARLKASRKEADRAQELVDKGVGTTRALETAISTRDVDAATLQVAQVELQTAEINLSRTLIEAELSGIVGRSLTTQGALVTTGQSTPLAVIRSLDPVYVDVTQSAAEILAWRRGSAQQQLDGANPEVTLILSDGAPYGVTGKMTAAEPYVNESTGVVTLRMTFPNPDGFLLPGMYVQVRMPQGVLEKAALAPQQGVMRDRRGNPIAYVANAENLVEQRDLTIAQARGSHWIVTEGLKSGDRLIVEGLQKIAPSAPVAPEERAAD